MVRNMLMNNVIVNEYLSSFICVIDLYYNILHVVVDHINLFQ